MILVLGYSLQGRVLEGICVHVLKEHRLRMGHGVDLWLESAVRVGHTHVVLVWYVT